MSLFLAKPLPALGSESSPFFPSLTYFSCIINFSISAYSLLLCLKTCFRIFYLNKQTNYRKPYISPHSPPATALFLSSSFTLLLFTFQPITCGYWYHHPSPETTFIKANHFYFYNPAWFPLLYSLCKLWQGWASPPWLSLLWSSVMLSLACHLLC